jgi:small subunit ribosomal protein S18
MAYGSGGGGGRGPARPAGPGGKNRRFKRRKVSFLTINKIVNVDYKDVNILRQFLDDRGRIVPRRRSGATAKEQRMVAIAIKRAREIALLPFVRE